jgi:glycine oxidase
VIIVGAGIIGLSCAWTLARAGRKVRVFDKGAAAREASWAGAGMLAPGGEFESDSELARMAMRSLALYPAFVDQLREATGVPIDFRRCGAVELGEEAELARVAALRASIGIRSERCAQGWFYPDDALVDPREVTAALLAACRGLGAVVHEHEAVLHVAADGRSVTTGLGRYEDEGVLIAAGAWSSALFEGLPASRPVRGHLIAYRMAPGFLPHIVRSGHTYVMQRSSGLVIVGSSTENAGFDRSLDETILADIRRRAEALVPALRSEEPIERWNGFRPGIAGSGPAIGRFEGTAVLTAFGHYRNGILLAPETARMVGELVLRS